MKVLLIINAIIWAAVILVAGWFFHDSPDYMYLLGALSLGFTLQNGFTYQYMRKKKPE